MRAGRGSGNSWLPSQEAKPGLNRAASMGCTDIAQIFLDSEAEVNARSRVRDGAGGGRLTIVWGGQYGDTPLHHAVKRANAEMFDLLVAAKADLHAKNTDSRTPLQLAVWGATQSAASYRDYAKSAELLRVRLLAADRHSKWPSRAEYRELMSWRLYVLNQSLHVIALNFSMLAGALSKLLHRVDCNIGRLRLC